MKRYKNIPQLIDLHIGQLVMWEAVVQSIGADPQVTVDVEIPGLEDNLYRKYMWAKLHNPRPSGRARKDAIIKVGN